jgi:uncharacterized UBP type Zn finger protein
VARLCSHLEAVRIVDLPEPPLACEECAQAGDPWMHLRMCVSCGHVGCCDNSPGRHAAAHFHESGHPLMRSAEPGEDWMWCYVDEIGVTPIPAAGNAPG